VLVGSSCCSTVCAWAGGSVWAMVAKKGFTLVADIPCESKAMVSEMVKPSGTNIVVVAMVDMSCSCRCLRLGVCMAS